MLLLLISNLNSYRRMLAVTLDCKNWNRKKLNHSRVKTRYGLSLRCLVLTMCMITISYLYFGMSYYWTSPTIFDFNDVYEDGDMDGVRYAIFYHVYINPTMVRLSLKIVNEQLAQWQASIHFNATLYYTQIGDISAPFPCPNNGRCQLLQKRRRGWEQETLINVYEYCQLYPENNVIYIHSKGSYHNNIENTSLRRVLTRSALSHECHRGLDNAAQCNICSARFSPLPHWHAAGNMWTAKCSYIQKLYPIVGFGAKVARISRQFRPSVARYPEWVLGTNRFADEHWAHTHPEVYPCDVYTDVEWMYGSGVLNFVLPLELFEKAPRNFTMANVTEFVNPPEPVVQMSYRLFELQQLYKATPANDSFVWTWYTQANVF